MAYIGCLSVFASVWFVCAGWCFSVGVSGCLGVSCLFGFAQTVLAR